jgi:CRISPR-associated protein Csy2
MSQYIVLSRIKVQNANCIAGFTWGFPAITHFLGFTHALHRKLSREYDITLGGCAVVSHDYQVHVYKPSPRKNYEFIQRKNPPVLAIHKKSSPPIIEEGKMNLTTSIIIEVTKELVATSEKIKICKKAIREHCLTGRIAGGTILTIGHVDLLSASTEKQLANLNRKLKRLMMPGFVLQDRSEYLKTHFNQLKENVSNAQILDAWLDFSAMKYQAQPDLKAKNTQPTLETKAEWILLPKPHVKGWLVPIMTGYKAISELSPAGKVANSRDANTPTCFVEAVHSIGEWKSMHRISDISEMIWKYQYKKDWYLCSQTSDEPKIQQEIVENETFNFEAALANL